MIAQKEVGRRIRERRKELNISADELATHTGKDRATIYRYENGSIENMSTNLLKPIADALDIPIGYLIDPDSSNKEIRNKFANNLSLHIDNSGKTQKEIAQAIGVSGATFSDWMKGKNIHALKK